MMTTKTFLLCRRIFRKIREYSAGAVLALALIAYISAWIGVFFSESIDSASRSLADRITASFYEAAQVLLLNMPSHDRADFGFFIAVARIAAVLLVGLVAAQAIGKLFRNSFDNFRLWLAGRRSVLVGGLGRIGFQLAVDYCEQNKLVIVQEIANPDYWTQAAEDAGAIVLEGDVTDIDSLRTHIFRDPAVIHLVTGDDLANINALVNVKRLRDEYAKSRRRPLGACDCYVHVDDPALHRTLNRCLLESNCTYDPDLRIHPFNIYHETACQLIIEKLTPIRPRRGEVALYVIFGFEQMGMAMLKELVEFAHFENQRRARILVLVPPSAESVDDNAAERSYQDCVAQWSRMTPRHVYDDLTKVTFDPECDLWTCRKQRPCDASGRVPESVEVEYAANVHFCQLRSAQSLTSTEAIALARLAGATDNNSGANSSVKTAVLFCFEEDERNFRMANELNDYWQDLEGINVKRDEQGIPEEQRPLYRRHQPFKIPVFAFLPRSGPLRAILEQSTDGCAIRPFGAVKEGIERAHDALIEEVAIDIAWSYDVENRHGMAACERPRAGDDPMAMDDQAGAIRRDGYHHVWSAKPFWEQLSNRNAAEHARIMMQIIGFSIAENRSAPGSSKIDFDALDEDDKRLMAAVEHNRWMAERLLMGWVYGPKMNQPPQRESLCPNEHLRDDEWIKDYHQVKTVLEFLQKRGVLFHRVGCHAT